MNIMQILFWFGLGCGIMATLIFVVRKLREWHDRVVAEAIAAFFEVFFVETKTDTSDSKENTLAKAVEMPDNPSVKDPESPAKPDKPFWDDAERLAAYKKQLEGGGEEDLSPEDETDLADLSPLEKWRQVDARLQDLRIDNETPESISA